MTKTLIIAEKPSIKKEEENLKRTLKNDAHLMHLRNVLFTMLW